MQFQTNLTGRGANAVRVTPSERRLADVRGTIERQAEAIAGLASQMNEGYGQAIDLILRAKGRLVVCGMGKSGLIARKLTATFSSTGTPSIFLHAADAIHGDLGMVTADDVIILISYSGETEEVVRLLPLLRQTEVPMIALVGKPESSLAQGVDVALIAGVDAEVCPNGLAPTTSTLAALAVGDALAVTLIREREFTPRDFARHHPGGSLGRSLLTKVRDEMRSAALPTIDEEASIAECVCTITAGRLGLAIVQRGEKVVGMVTDGDLRRALTAHTDLTKSKVGHIMTADPMCISPDAMIEEAEERLQSEKVKALVVLDDSGKLVGVFDIFHSR